MSKKILKRNLIITKVEVPIKITNKKTFMKKNALNLDIDLKKKVKEIILQEFTENFSDILIKSKDIFFNKIKNEVEHILKSLYPSLKNELKEIIEMSNQNIEEFYNKNYSLLKSEWKKYQKEPNKYNFLTHYRKHCINTDNFAYHSCNKNSKLIEITNNKNEVTHLICIECKRCFLSNEILLICNNCSLEYYSCIINKNEDINLLPATWEKYHCGGIINNTMKCIKCQNILYLNLKNNYLTCLNEKCKFKAKPESIIWNCAICKTEFKSNAKIYNPLEMDIIKRGIRKSLLFKENAYPNEIPCCKANPQELIFFHKEDCKGELYNGNISNNKIIVCGKCRAMNFYDKFIWTCPLCLKKFKSYKSPFISIFKKKEYIIIDNASASISPGRRDRYNERFKDTNNNGSNEGIRKIGKYFSRNYQENTPIKATKININRINKSSDGNTIVKLVSRSIPKRKGRRYLYDILQQRNNSNSKEKDNKVNYNVKFPINNIEVDNNFSTNETSSLGNASNQPTRKIRRITVNLNETLTKSNKSKNEEEEEYSFSNERTLKTNKTHKSNKTKSFTKKNSKKLDEEELEKEEEMDKISDLKEDNNYLGISKRPSLKWNMNKNNKIFDKIDSIGFKPERRGSQISLGELSSNSEISMNVGNILTNPEKLKLIVDEGTIPEFEIEDFEYIEPIGEGSYGKIYLVQNKYDDSKYAVKKIICHDLKEVKSIHNNLELIYSKKHPNIMKIIGVEYKCLDITTYSLYILMELALSDWNTEIKKRAKEKKYYTEEEIINILKQIINSIIYLENEGIAHRDIKPQNILVFENNVYKITDFGEAKNLSDSVKESTLRGSQLFMSPVLYNGLKYNQKDVIHNAYKSDVYSLGYCLIYALTLNLNILNDLREIISMKVIHSMISKNIKKHYSGKMIDLITKMLEFDEKERFSFNDIQKYIQENYN